MANHRTLFINEDFSKQRRFRRRPPTTGTGFAFLPGGYIATCQHVVAGGRKITISSNEEGKESEIEASLIKEDQRIDLRLHINQNQLKNLGAIPYQIRKTQAEVGENVFILGYPLPSTMGNELKLTTGIISSLSGFQGDTTCYQVSAPVQPGNSGGPAFDGSGRLIGVVSAKHSGAENVTYIIKASYLLNLDSELSMAPDQDHQVL